MATVIAATPAASPSEALDFARGVLRVEAEAILRVCGRLDGSIAEAAGLIHRCPGSVVVTGMGKAGLVGQKVAATLASTGTHAFPLHPADAFHGDLGRIRAGDLVLALSQSGETEEVTRLGPAVRRLGAGLIALTGSPTSTLGRQADLCIALGPIAEACPLGLAPSASTTAMMAVGDALALLVSRMRGFRPEDFLRYHPGGSLGRTLTRVEEVMRTGDHVRTADPAESVRAVFVRLGGARRRSGAVLVVGEGGTLAGIFTDSDLARLFERRREAMLDRPIGEAMTTGPVVVHAGASIAEAVDVLRSRKLSELPVVDDHRRLVGLVDITDLIGLGADDLES
ncbi:KpsF/GutQ family sugar-phosphate isomerase [Tautonia plasticadhaerens]|uniref:Arabinose 5-phosphate isomerase KdsD n=1 Tax=Tautonia plasticadhaerens TaxID=2527974 RepID=A0A518GYE1_9BACT|nr:KpsF/GutQ family sugar-phosphate isomerase [Tautonia plasticadhaerens]QDV33562.1 Arabinose 5-phosphate isomerase KdsD [Tautonia plasticadhaerens]